MTNQEKMGLLMALYNGIFQSKAQNTDITAMGVPSPHVPNGIVMGRWFVNGTLRGFDFNVLHGGMLQLRIVEQNPDKLDAAGNRSYYANLAHQGHCVAWVIDRKKETDAFLGRIQAGQWHASKQRATVSAIPVTQQTAAALVPSVEGIPDIPNDANIPDYVLVAISEDEEGEYGLDQYEQGSD